jgi:hypothetical protein
MATHGSRRLLTKRPHASRSSPGSKVQAAADPARPDHEAESTASPSGSSTRRAVKSIGRDPGAGLTATHDYNPNHSAIERSNKRKEISSICRVVTPLVLPLAFHAVGPSLPYPVSPMRASAAPPASPRSDTPHLYAPMLKAFPSTSSEGSVLSLFSMNEGTSTAATTPSPGTPALLPAEIESEQTLRTPKKLALLIGITYAKSPGSAAEHDSVVADEGQAAVRAAPADSSDLDGPTKSNDQSAAQQGEDGVLERPHSDCKEFKKLLIGEDSPCLTRSCRPDGFTLSKMFTNIRRRISRFYWTMTCILNRQKRTLCAPSTPCAPQPHLIAHFQIEEMRKLVSDARPGDTFCFLYSGHGTQAECQPDDPRPEQDGFDECVCHRIHLPIPGSFASWYSHHRRRRTHHSGQCELLSLALNLSSHI